jgi:HEAT repeat protein
MHRLWQSGYGFSAIVSLSCLILLGFWYWLSEPVAIAEIKAFEQISAQLSQPASPSALSQAKFRDITFMAGLQHRHVQKKDQLLSFEDTLTASVCVADFNNDGFDDLFFTTGSGNLRHFGKQNWWHLPQLNQLYLNRQGQYFENVSAMLGSEAASFSLSCLVDDLDQDGYLDLIVGNKGKNQLFHNQQGTQFKLVKDAFNEDPAAFTTAILLKDLDGDQQDELLFGNYVSFVQNQNMLELNAGYANFKESNFDVTFFDAEPDHLYRKIAPLHYQLTRDDGTSNRQGRTLNYVDRDTLLALNDSGSPSRQLQGPLPWEKFVLNARDMKFFHWPQQTESEFALGSFAGRTGLFVLETTDFANEKSWDQWVNRAETLFAHSWSVAQADFDLDGYDDFFLANGSVLPHPDAAHMPVGQPNHLLLMRPELKNFQTQQLSAERVASSRGAAVLDFNLDGKMDLVIGNNNDYPTLLKNEAQSQLPWFGLKCLPAFLCKKAQLFINDTLVQNAFAGQRTFGSFSLHGYLHRGALAQSRIEVVTAEKRLQLQIPQLQQYYLLDLQKATLSALPPAAPEATAAEQQIESALYQLGQGHYDGSFYPLYQQHFANNPALLAELMALLQTKPAKPLFPLLDEIARTQQPELALPAIELLRQFELEQTVPTLLHLLSSADAQIQCAASRALQFYHWKDEAVPERKGLAVPAVLQLLPQQQAMVQSCFIELLAETESYRAVSTLQQFLQSDHELLVSQAARALGYLRQTETAADLTAALARTSSPIAKAHILIALNRLQQPVAAVSQMLSTMTERERWFFVAASFQSDDAVSQQQHAVAWSSLVTLPQRQLLAALDLATLVQLYQQFPTLHGNNFIAEFSQLWQQGAIQLSEPAQQLQVFIALPASEQLQLLPLLSQAALLQVLKLPQMQDRQSCLRLFAAAPELCQPLDVARLSAWTARLKQLLHSGHYQTASLVASQLAVSAHYPLLLEDLLTDPGLQVYEKLYISSHFPLPPEIVAIAPTLFGQLAETERRQLSRILHRRLSDAQFVQLMAQQEIKDSRLYQRWFSQSTGAVEAE